MTDKLQTNWYEKPGTFTCCCEKHIKPFYCSHSDCYGSCGENYDEVVHIICGQCRAFRKLRESQEMKKLH